jgi:hypothetical protein
MMATLSVQEAMGFKVDREAVATLVLPQLWSMSIGPCTSCSHTKHDPRLTRTSVERWPIPKVHASHQKVGRPCRERA